MAHAGLVNAGLINDCLTKQAQARPSGPVVPRSWPPRAGVGDRPKLRGGMVGSLKITAGVAPGIDYVPPADRILAGAPHQTIVDAYGSAHRPISAGLLCRA